MWARFERNDDLDSIMYGPMASMPAKPWYDAISVWASLIEMIYNRAPHMTI